MHLTKKRLMAMFMVRKATITEWLLLLKKAA